MDQAEFIRTVANVSGVSQSVVRDVIETAADVIAETLGQRGEESVAVPALGKFHPRDRLPRLGRNPKTGEELSLPGVRHSKFVPGKRFRDRVAGRA